MLSWLNPRARRGNWRFNGGHEMEWMLLPFRRYAEFAGRSCRREYWMFALLSGVVYALAAILMFAGGLFGLAQNSANFSSLTPLFYLGLAIAIIFFLAALVPSIAVTVRRLHDRNLSGWWYLGVIVLGQIPYLGFLINIAFLVFMVMPGDNGPNRFGADPLDPSRVDVFA